MKKTLPAIFVPFLLPYWLLFFLVGALQIVYFQSVIALWVNRHWSFGADYFFRYVTYLGDGVFCILLGVTLFFVRRRRLGVLVLLAYALSGLLAQLIKNFGFPDAPRPSEYFWSMMSQIHKVSGVDLLQWHSFPSGHTASAFAVFGTLAYLVGNQSVKFIFFVLALAVGYSRMYLFQHFLVDVWIGSLLGLATSYVLVQWQKRWKNNFWSQ
jgi:membrane-associated phospholipid phosphatase